MGSKKPDELEAAADPSEPVSRTDAVARLKTDFDRFYFVTGQMDLDLYEEDCTFADPFVAFNGRQRFKVRSLPLFRRLILVVCFLFVV